MPSHDNQGREYAKLSKLKAGDVVTFDDSFSCLPPWSYQAIKAAPALYVECMGCSRHYLDGQLSDDKEHLVGVYDGVVQAQ